MKYIKIYSLLSIVVFCSSCEMGEQDNYDEPNGRIYGTVTDNLTNEPFQSEQPNGYQVIMEEKNENIPIKFWGKPEGTFENAWIFQDDYNVYLEGAFFPVDPINVTVGSGTEVDFTVTPFIAVTDVSVQASSGKITSSYQIARSQAGDKISELKTLVSDVPTVNNAVFVASKETNVSGISDEEILTTSFTDEVTGLNPGVYYVRIAARTQNTLNRYNYSKVFQVTVQ